jgi:hypothetical protein
MNIYNKIRTHAQVAGAELTDTDVKRIAGTLRFAGMAAFDSVLARELSEMGKRIEAEKQAVEAQTFQKIDASLSDGNCPRCGQKMKDVKLADYTPAKYCDRECRITLWTTNEEK